MKKPLNYWKTDNNDIERFAKGFFQSCGKSYTSSFQTTRDISKARRKK